MKGRFTARHALLLTLALSFLLAGLPVAAHDDDGFTCPSTGGTFITAINADPVSLNGVYANDGASVAVLSYVFNPLTLGGENWGTEITGDLAESWEVSEDGLTWTFHLRPDVTWQDGAPLTAADVVYTYQTIQSAEEDIAPFRSRFMQNGEPIQFEATDDLTVVATLSEPNASFFTDISVPIVPKHILETQNLRDGEFNRTPIGTGPFQVVEWNTGESIVLEANENYFRGRPCLDRIIFQIIPEDQAQVNALLTGDIDFIDNVPGASVAQFENNPEFTLQVAELDSLFSMVFNLEREQFQDPAVRQALMIAIDRQGVIDTVLQGYGEVHNSHFDAVVPFYEQDKLGGYDYDPERAGQILDELGITDSDCDGDGIRDVDGEPWVVNIVTFTEGFRDYSDYAQVVQAYWEDIGIDVELEQRDLATLVDQLYANTQGGKPYDVHTTGWSIFGPEPNSYSNLYVTTDSGTNIASYNNERVNELFAAGRAETDFDARMAIYEEIEQILWEELPYIPIYRQTQPAVVSNRFNIEDAELNLSLGTNFTHPERIYQVGE
jgi:peptide/nickel transport system substrate-binding protein